MRSFSLFVALVATTTPLAVTAASYKLDTEYKGNSFFNGWDFTVGIDANTTGNILYQAQSDAQSQGLISVNGAGNAIMKVDNTTVGQGDTYGRASVRINSQKRISYGSLTILDAVHLPYGCSVWPAFWTQGENWPNNGEIDIMENVNLDTANQYTLHTLNGCQHPPAGSGQDTGTLVFQDCFNATNGNSGCVVRDTRSTSYGAGFASAGGGVFAMEWNSNGISIWFFPRGQIPSDASGTSPNPSGWGKPVANWPASSCDPKKFFGPQQIIFDITLCGNFAGLDNVFHATCPNTAHCTDLIKDPTNYNNAYFEVSYLRTFADSSASGGSNSASSWSMGLVSTTSALAAALMMALGFTAGSAVL